MAFSFLLGRAGFRRAGIMAERGKVRPKSLPSMCRRAFFPFCGGRSRAYGAFARNVAARFERMAERAGVFCTHFLRLPGARMGRL
jgi:hypothetical protein